MLYCMTYLPCIYLMWCSKYYLRSMINILMRWFGHRLGMIHYILMCSLNHQMKGRNQWRTWYKHYLRNILYSLRNKIHICWLHYCQPLHNIQLSMMNMQISQSFGRYHNQKRMVDKFPFLLMDSDNKHNLKGMSWHHKNQQMLSKFCNLLRSIFDIKNPWVHNQPYIWYIDQ